MNATSANVTYHSSQAASGLSLATLVIYISFSSLGIIGNGLVLYVIAMVKELHDTTNLFIVNQSLIDGMSSLLLLGNFVLPRPPLPRNNPALARFLCGFWYSQFPYWATYVATLVNLLILTLERYFAVVYPLRYRRHVNGRLVIGFSLVPWLLGFLQQVYLITVSKVEDHSCHLFVWPKKIVQPAMGIYAFVMYFVVTFFAMFFMYVRIFRKLREGPKTGAGNVHQNTNYREQARRNVVKTMMSLSICYSACLAPGQFTYLLYCSGIDIDFEGTFYYIMVCIAFINIWINPFVYTFQYHKFQNGLKVVFGCPRRAPDVQVRAICSTSKPTQQV